MSEQPHETAAQILREHERGVAELHRKLAAVPGADGERLRRVVDHHAAAVKAFCDDAQQCWKA
jgi:hypothetical protein